MTVKSAGLHEIGGPSGHRRSTSQEKCFGIQAQVKCLARTRIPTVFGNMFLHIYECSDGKEHLAFVVDEYQQWSIDSAYEKKTKAIINESNINQLSEALNKRQIRSLSLNMVWSEDETRMDRITRGASLETMKLTEPSTPITMNPLVRIHSECFTGETIGSLRCDCGEQLDEAIRIMFESPEEQGICIYMRQEGRGIGLVEKIKSYNLQQDLGYDTVAANIALGHLPDHREYSIAAAMLRDLGITGDSSIRLLTNNPLKISAMENESISVSERVTMIPKSWKSSRHAVKTTMGGSMIHPGGILRNVSQMASMSTTPIENDISEPLQEVDDAWRKDLRSDRVHLRAGAVYGRDLDIYMSTKISSMGHLLALPGEQSDDR